MWYLMYTEVKYSGPKTEAGYKEYCYTEQVHVQWGYAITDIQATASELTVKYKFQCLGRFNTKQEALAARENHRNYGVADSGLDLEKIEREKAEAEEKARRAAERLAKQEEKKKNTIPKKQSTLVLNTKKDEETEGEEEDNSMSVPWLNANLKIREKNEKKK